MITLQTEERPTWLFDVALAADGYFHFRLIAPNGEAVLASEPFRSRLSCEMGIDSLRHLTRDDSRFTPWSTKSGFYYFSVDTGEGEVLAKSMMFEKEHLMDACIELVRCRAASAMLS